MLKRLLLITGLLILFAAEILKVYFIMPFPGSQQQNTIDIAYFIHTHIWWFRLLGLLLIANPLYNIFTKKKTGIKILLSVVLALYAVIFYMFNFRFLAEKMFYQPGHKSLADVMSNTTSVDKLIVGIAINGEAKAYPINIIGYHHQVKDTVGGEAVMVTYCTVCRTGRIFSPFVDGKYEQFRLVGMDHFNAMFEDATTKSWWRQATGEAIAGPLKGKTLKELPSEQMKLSAWIRKYPATKILQPDTTFNKKYEKLKDFDAGTIEGNLEKRDSASWQFKSWVVGILIERKARAYDWNELVEKILINDTVDKIPVILVIEKDSISYHAWKRDVDGQTLNFVAGEIADVIKDTNTGSLWNMDGICIEGVLKDKRLVVVPAYQEFWHSWKYFHPATTQYPSNKK